MPDGKTLDEYYKALTDHELLKRRAEGGFTPEAELVLDQELARRNLTVEEAKRYFAPEWLDKADVGTVGILTLENGKRIAAEIVGLNEEGDQLVVDVIPRDSSHRNGDRSDRAIPFHQIVSFEPQPHFAKPWPYSDPCRGTFSRERFALMTTLFLSMILGSLPLFFLLMRKPYGLQEASIIIYTMFVMFFTFAKTGGGVSGPDRPPYLFTCPAVQPQIPRLLWRHFGFLVALFALQTAAQAARSNLPDWWNIEDRKGTTPFELALMFLCLGLGLAQVFTNRSILDRAHREFSA